MLVLIVLFVLFFDSFDSHEISCSRDGTAKLWDIPTQTNITTFATPGDPGLRSAVNDCCVFAQDAAQAQGNKAQDPREVGTEGKAIVTAGEDGMLRIFDVRITKSYFLFLLSGFHLFSTR